MTIIEKNTGRKIPHAYIGICGVTAKIKIEIIEDTTVELLFDNYYDIDLGDKYEFKQRTLEELIGTESNLKTSIGEFTGELVYTLAKHPNTQIYHLATQECEFTDNVMDLYYDFERGIMIWVVDNDYITRVESVYSIEARDVSHMIWNAVDCEGYLEQKTLCRLFKK